MERTYTSSEAGIICGVPQASLLDWRRRGLLPAGNGKWTRYSVRDMAYLRLAAAFSRCGLTIAMALEVGEAFADQLLSALKGAELDPAGEVYSEQFALVAKTEDGSLRWSSVFSLDQIPLALTEVQAEEFRSLVVVNLTAEARAMARRMKYLLQDHREAARSSATHDLAIQRIVRKDK